MPHFFSIQKNTYKSLKVTSIAKMHSTMPKNFRGRLRPRTPQLPRLARTSLVSRYRDLAALRAALRKSKMQIDFDWMQKKYIYSHVSISWVPKVNMGMTKMIKNTTFYEKM